MRVEPKSNMIYWHHEMSIHKMLGEHAHEFDALYDFTDRIPGSFTRLNAAMLFQFAKDVSGVVVEVGVDQGRSASVLLHCSEHTGSQVYLVDSWGGILEANRAKTMEMARHFPKAQFDVMALRSEDAARVFRGEVDLLHIDAHHYEGGVDVDCQVWLPKVRSGGLALFHDYASTFDAVTESVDRYTEGWEDLGSWDSLAVRRNV